MKTKRRILQKLKRGLYAALVGACVCLGPQITQADTSFVYLPNSTAQTLHVFDTNAKTFATPITLNGRPNDVLVHPSGKKVYVSLVNSNNPQQAGSVAVINTLTQAVEKTIQVGAAPVGMTFNQNASRLYVANSQTNNISVINTVTDNALFSYQNIPTGPVAVAVSNTNPPLLYIASVSQNSISIINTSTNAGSSFSTFPIQVGGTLFVSNPNDLVYDSGALFVLDWGSNPPPNNQSNIGRIYEISQIQGQNFVTQVVNNVGNPPSSFKKQGDFIYIATANTLINLANLNNSSVGLFDDLIIRKANGIGRDADGKIYAAAEANNQTPALVVFPAGSQNPEGTYPFGSVGDDIGALKGGHFIGPKIICGDNDVGPGEECDGGPNCSAQCKTIPPPMPVCGDGVLDIANQEDCDDGALLSGDGCSATCTVEAGYTCNQASPTVCTQDPSGPICGNAVRENNEACDDGDTGGGDGCAANCLSVEANFTCTEDANGKSTCTPLLPPPPACGDGKVNGTEVCDDANKNSGDGCTADCQVIEAGYTCVSDATGKSVCTENQNGGESSGGCSLNAQTTKSGLFGLAMLSIFGIFALKRRRHAH